MEWRREGEEGNVSVRCVARTSVVESVEEEEEAKAGGRVRRCMLITLALAVMWGQRKM